MGIAAKEVSPLPLRSAPSRNLEPAFVAPVAPSQASIAIRYLKRAPIRVQGPVSGRHYEFSVSQPVQSVDARDAVSMLNTGLFHRA